MSVYPSFKIKKILFTLMSLLSVVGYGYFVFAAAPTGGYDPGATLNPDCNPGDTSPEPCIVNIATNWTLTGNTGTTAGTNFIGTTDAQDLVLKTNGNQIARFGQMGNAAIGSDLTGIDSTLVLPTATTFGSMAFQSGQSSGILSTAFQLGTASNDLATAFGAGVATGSSSFAWGADSIGGATPPEASGTSSTAWGNRGVIASGNTSTAFGIGTIASGAYSTAFGDTNTARSYSETSFGFFGTNYVPSDVNNYNVLDRLFTIGNGTTSAHNAFTLWKDGSFVFNDDNFQNDNSGTDQNIFYFNYGNHDGLGAAQTKRAIRLGSALTDEWDINSVNVGDGSIALGFSSLTDSITAPIASGLYTLAFGGGSTASNDGAVSIGLFSTASGLYSSAFGATAIASGDNSFAFGVGANVSGADSLGFGSNTTASGDNSLAFGTGTTASGLGSVAFGVGANVSGADSLGFGSNTTASGDNSLAFGAGALATQTHGIAIGTGTTASGLGSVAFGVGSTASATTSFALGGTASGAGGAIAIGNGTISSGIGSFASGNDTVTASGDHSVAIGEVSTASGYASYAFHGTASGTNSYSLGVNTLASGDNSYALGVGSTASGQVSFSLGTSVTAPSFGEMEVGRNSTGYTPGSASTFVGTDRLFNVGNGNVGSSDAFTILKNGKTGIGIDNFETTASSALLQVGDSSWAGDMAVFQNSAGTCTITNPSGWTCSSDARLKTNIETISDYGLSSILALRPVTFDWTRGTNTSPTIGFIAQEVQTVVPNIVTTDPSTGYLSLNTTEMTPILVKAIQDMNLRVIEINDMSKPNPWRDALTAWFANVSNGITDFFTKTSHTENLCVGTTGDETCITKSQLDQLLNKNNVPIVSPVVPSTSDTVPVSDPVPTTDSTPTSDPTPVSDPVPTPDPVPSVDPVPTPDTTPVTDPAPTPDPAPVSDPAPAPTQ